MDWMTLVMYVVVPVVVVAFLLCFKAVRRAMGNILEAVFDVLSAILD